jgi:hypothetical protein
MFPATSSLCSSRITRAAVKFCLVLPFVAALSGCGAHRMMQLIPRYDISRSLGTPAHPPHHRKVFVTNDMLEPGSYDMLGFLEVTRVWWGSTGGVLDAMADMGRELGADAIIGARTWFQPVGWSMLSPQGEGIAVALKSPSAVDLTKELHGEYR